MQVQICNFKSAKGKLYEGWTGVITENKDDGKFMVKFDNIEKQASFAPKNLEWTSLEVHILKKLSFFFFQQIEQK